jgi:hypothetical protein
MRAVRRFTPLYPPHLKTGTKPHCGKSDRFISGPDERQSVRLENHTG